MSSSTSTAHSSRDGSSWRSDCPNPPGPQPTSSTVRAAGGTKASISRRSENGYVGGAAAPVPPEGAPSTVAILRLPFRAVGQEQVDVPSGQLGGPALERRDGCVAQAGELLEQVGRRGAGLVEQDVVELAEHQGPQRGQ